MLSTGLADCDRHLGGRDNHLLLRSSSRDVDFRSLIPSLAVTEFHGPSVFETSGLKFSQGTFVGQVDVSSRFFASSLNRSIIILSSALFSFLLLFNRYRLSVSGIDLFCTESRINTFSAYNRLNRFTIKKLARGSRLAGPSSSAFLHCQRLASAAGYPTMPYAMLTSFM